MAINNLTNAQNSLLVIKNRLSFFDDFTNDEVLKITKDIEFKKYKKGEIIFEQAEMSTDIHYIMNGSVNVLLGSVKQGGWTVSYENHVSLAILPKRAIFGEMSAITGEKRSARIIANEDRTSLLKFKIDNEIRDDNKVIIALLYQQFIEVLSDKLKVLTKKLYS